MDLLNSPKEVMLDVLLFLTVISLAIQDAMIVLKTYIWSVKLMHLAIQNGNILVVNGQCQAVLTRMKAAHVLKNHVVIGLAFQDILAVIGLATEKNLVVKFLMSGMNKVAIISTLGTEKILMVIGPAILVMFMGFNQVTWINEVGSASTDLSRRAFTWWVHTMQETMRTYQTWLASTPLERSQLTAPQPNLEHLGHPQEVRRLERRATTLLLGAIPEDIKSNLIAQRELWPSAIMYKVLRCYCPGGWKERMQPSGVPQNLHGRFPFRGGVLGEP